MDVEWFVEWFTIDTFTMNHILLDVGGPAAVCWAINHPGKHATIDDEIIDEPARKKSDCQVCRRHAHLGRRRVSRLIELE